MFPYIPMEHLWVRLPRGGSACPLSPAGTAPGVPQRLQRSLFAKQPGWRPPGTRWWQGWLRGSGKGGAGAAAARRARRAHGVLLPTSEEPWGRGLRSRCIAAVVRPQPAATAGPRPHRQLRRLRFDRCGGASPAAARQRRGEPVREVVAYLCSPPPPPTWLRHDSPLQTSEAIPDAHCCLA